MLGRGMLMHENTTLATLAIVVLGVGCTVESSDNNPFGTATTPNTAPPATSDPGTDGSGGSGSSIGRARGPRRGPPGLRGEGTWDAERAAGGHRLAPVTAHSRERAQLARMERPRTVASVLWPKRMP